MITFAVVLCQQEPNSRAKQAKKNTAPAKSNDAATDAATSEHLQDSPSAASNSEPPNHLPDTAPSAAHLENETISAASGLMRTAFADSPLSRGQVVGTLQGKVCSQELKESLDAGHSCEQDGEDYAKSLQSGARVVKLPLGLPAGSDYFIGSVFCQLSFIAVGDAANSNCKLVVSQQPSDANSADRCGFIEVIATCDIAVDTVLVAPYEAEFASSSASSIATPSASSSSSSSSPNPEQTMHATQDGIPQRLEQREATKRRSEHIDSVVTLSHTLPQAKEQWATRGYALVAPSVLPELELQQLADSFRTAVDQPELQGQPSVSIIGGAIQTALQEGDALVKQFRHAGQSLLSHLQASRDGWLWSGAKVMVSKKGAGEQPIHFDSSGWSKEGDDDELITVLLYAEPGPSTLLPSPSMRSLELFTQQLFDDSRRKDPQATALLTEQLQQYLLDRRSFSSIDVPAGTMLLLRHCVPHAGVECKSARRIVVFDEIGRSEEDFSRDDFYAVWNYAFHHCRWTAAHHQTLVANVRFGLLQSENRKERKEALYRFYLHETKPMQEASDEEP